MALPAQGAGRSQQKKDRRAEQIGHDLRRPDRGIVDAEDVDERLVGERQHFLMGLVQISCRAGVLLWTVA